MPVPFSYGPVTHSAGASATLGSLSNTIPVHPPGVDVNANMFNMWLMGWLLNPALSLLEFRHLVHTGGAWDYKQLDPKYDPFGNFNYGAAGTALGIDPYTLQNEAGKAEAPGAGQGTPGNPFDPSSGTPPYGDRPQDNAEIQAGINYAHSMGY